MLSCTQRAFLGAVLLALGSSALPANIIPMSGAVSLRADGQVSGTTLSGGGGASHSDLKATSATPFAGFSDTAQGSSTFTVDQPPDVEFYHPATNTATSWATIDATVGSNVISMDGGTYAGFGWHVGAPFMNVSASASASLDFTFYVDQWMSFDASFEQHSMHGHGLYPDAPVFRLSSKSGDWSLDSDPRYDSYSSFNTSALLAPGEYRLSYSAGGVVTGDPLGDFDESSTHFLLAARDVDESLPVLIVTAASLLTLLTIHRRRRAARDGA